MKGIIGKETSRIIEEIVKNDTGGEW